MDQSGSDGADDCKIAFGTHNEVGIVKQQQNIIANGTTAFGNPFYGVRRDACDAFDEYLFNFGGGSSMEQIAEKYGVKVNSEFVSKYPRDKLIDAVNKLRHELEGKSVSLSCSCSSSKCRVQSILSMVEQQIEAMSRMDPIHSLSMVAKANGRENTTADVPSTGTHGPSGDYMAGMNTGVPGNLPQRAAGQKPLIQIAC